MKRKTIPKTMYAITGSTMEGLTTRQPVEVHKIPNDFAWQSKNGKTVVHGIGLHTWSDGAWFSYASQSKRDVEFFLRGYKHALAMMRRVTRIYGQGGQMKVRTRAKE